MKTISLCKFKGSVFAKCEAPPSGLDTFHARAASSLNAGFVADGSVNHFTRHRGRPRWWDRARAVLNDRTTN